MPAIVLPHPSQLPHEGGQILEFPIITREILDDLSYSLIVEIKEISVFDQPLKLEFWLPPPPLSLPLSFLPYMEGGKFVVLRVQVTVLGALAYRAFAPPEFALFYMNVLYPVLPTGFPDPSKFMNAQYHKQKQPNPFPPFSFLPTLPSSPLAEGAELD